MKKWKERKGVLKKEMEDVEKEEGREVEVLKEGRTAMEEEMKETEEREWRKKGVIEGREDGT